MEKEIGTGGKRNLKILNGNSYRQNDVREYRKKEKARLFSGKVKDFHFMMNRIFCKQKA